MAATRSQLAAGDNCLRDINRTLESDFAAEMKAAASKPATPMKTPCESSAFVLSRLSPLKLFALGLIIRRYRRSADDAQAKYHCRAAARSTAQVLELLEGLRIVAPVAKSKRAACVKVEVQNRAKV